MPRDQALTLTGTVNTTQDRKLELAGAVMGSSAASLSLSGTVSRSRIESLDGPSITLGVRVRLAEEWIPDEDLVGSVSFHDALDTPNQRVSFTLAGRRYSLMQTMTTWTRVPVEVWTYQGPPGDGESKLMFRGFGVPGTRQAGGLDPTVTVEAETASVFGDQKLCGEIPPFSGLSRGDIARTFVDGAGLGISTRIPAGSAFVRPLIASNQTLLRFLLDLGRPEGWHWRLIPDAGDGLMLEALTADLKLPPQAPDHTWHIDDCERIDLEAPARPASRVVLRGFVALSLTEAGVEIERTRTEIREPYAPKSAVEEQRTDGSIVSVSGSSSESLRTVVLIENEVHRRAGKDIALITREFGWRNPRAARLRTPRGGEAPGPAEGYHYTRSWIDEEGEYRIWRSERFGQRNERRISHSYDADTNLSRSVIEDFRYFPRTSGVKATLSGAWVVDAGVGTDDQSYLVTWRSGPRRGIESYGRAEQHVMEYVYDAATGAQLSEKQTSHGYYSKRGAVDVADHFLRFDGSAQEDLVANWIRIREVERRNGLLDDGRLGSELEVERGFFALVKKDGFHDWGGNERSNRVSEIFRTVRSHVVTYLRSGDGSVTAIRFRTDGAPEVERLTEETIPLPRFQLSPWTRLRQTSFEVTLDDPFIAELFGQNVVVLSSEYFANPEEAQRLALEIRRRSLARKVRVRRLETLAALGDTVLLIDPHQGLLHRGLLVERTLRRAAARGISVGDYLLEVYL